MAQIIHLVYHPKTSEEGRTLFLLDDNGDIWFTDKPFSNKPEWELLKLPAGLDFEEHYEEDE